MLNREKAKEQDGTWGGKRVAERAEGSEAGNKTEHVSGSDQQDM